MNYKKIVLLIGMIIAGLMVWQQPIHAMKQSDLNNRVYLVTMINANAYRTDHQFAFFAKNGQATYVNVEDTDKNGNPVVDSKASKEEQAAPETIRHLLNRPRYLRKQAKANVFTLKSHHRFVINNGKVHASPAGKLAAGAKPDDFTVTYNSSKQPYTSVHFKLAPKSYQYHWKK